MTTKETSFINRFISSIKDFEKYPEMAAKPFSSVIKYWLQLMLIFTLVVTMVSVYKLSISINNGIGYFKTEIPELSFVDGTLNVDSEEKIEIRPETVIDLLIIDTNDIKQEQVDNYTNKIQSENAGVIFLKDKLIVNLGRGVISYSYKDLASMYNINDMNKQYIINYFSGSNLFMLYAGIFVMSFISLFITYSISIIIDIIVLAGIGYITALVLRLRLKFIAMIKMTIHAITLPMILNMFYIIARSIFGFEIKYFEVMYITITYIYIIAAILMIKSDLIKRGQELTKIIEEEQRIKEELEKEKEKQKEEEERRKKEDEKKDKDNSSKKKKKDKTDSKDDDVGEAPQGENA